MDIRIKIVMIISAAALLLLSIAWMVTTAS